MEASIADLFSQAISICSMMVTVIILPSLFVGLIISMFQAATQINEQTLSFLPRLMITFATLILAGPWLGTVVVNFTQELIHQLPSYIH